MLVFIYKDLYNLDKYKISNLLPDFTYPKYVKYNRDLMQGMPYNNIYIDSIMKYDSLFYKCY